MLSEHFSTKEFLCKCGCNKIEIDPILIAKLEMLRFYMQEPIYINSGYRCSSHNEAVGGVKNSLHLKGKAADIRASDMVKLGYYSKIVFRNSGLGVYPNFFHVDTGPKNHFIGK